MPAVKSVVMFGLVCFLMLALGCGPSDVEKARQYIKDGKFSQAYALLSRQTAENPEDAEALFLLGVALINTGRISAAEGPFATAIRVNADFEAKIGEAYRKAGDIALQAGNTEQSVRLFKAAVHHRPGLKESVARSFYTKGQDLSRAGQEAQAIEIHQFALAINPLLGKEIGRWYAIRAAKADSASDQANLLRAASQFETAYKEEVRKRKQASAAEEAAKRAMSLRAKMKHVIAQRLDERAWERLAIKSLKTLGANETLQWTVKYYARAGYDIKRLELDGQGWTPLGSFANQSHMFFLSSQDFWYLKSSGTQPQTIQAAITKAKGIQFRGEAYMDISLRTESPPTEVFYWVAPRF